MSGVYRQSPSGTSVDDYEASGTTQSNPDGLTWAEYTPTAVIDITAVTGYITHCVWHDVQLWQQQMNVNYIGLRLLPSLSYATLYLSTMSLTL